MRRTWIVALCIGAALAVAPAAAEAAPEWEWKVPPWKVVPAGTKEAGFGGTITVEFNKPPLHKDTCHFKAGATIENAGGHGLGTIDEAAGVCTGWNGTHECSAPYEFYIIKPTVWTTELTGVAPFDEIAAPELRFECKAGSGAFEGTYTGVSLTPEMVVGHLHFTGLASGVLKKGTWELYLKGKPELVSEHKLRGS